MQNLIMTFAVLLGVYLVIFVVAELNKRADL